jgi:poly(3-hydroxybutyrate) depolymerase
MHSPSYRTLFGFAFLLALALGGCAGGVAVAPHEAGPMIAASGSANPTATPTPSSSPASGPTTPASAMSPTPAPSAGASAAPATTCISGPNPTTTTLVRNPVKLKSYSVDPAKIFVAGISSGGFFGVQMHVAHSTVFKGAAIYAGGLFYCSQDSVALALVNCGGETNVNCQALYNSELSASESYLDTQSAAGTIDNESNLAGQPVYLWSGTNDSVVNPKEMADLASEYGHYGANVTFDNSYPANHGWESPDGEVPCPTATEPYMVSCNGSSGKPYDSVQTWMTKFLGPLHARNNGTLAGSLINVDQTEFGAAAANSMDTDGWVFVPQSCATGATCGFVLALHGCIQNQAIIGTKFITESGIDEWADTNNLIVLYPYAITETTPALNANAGINPMGCWDWWGYDDSNYAVKTGTQMSIVYKMVQRVTGSP